MKQTNNAIKFLMAQYRAIFKQAYLKGLVSAVIVTTGLAAGASANAANFFDNNNTLDKTFTSDTTQVFITGQSTSAGNGYYEKINSSSFSGSTQKLKGTLTIQGGGASSSVNLLQSADTNGFNILGKEFNLVINTTNSTDGLALTTNNTGIASSIVDIGSINVQKGLLHLGVNAVASNTSGGLSVSAQNITVGTTGTDRNASINLATLASYTGSNSDGGDVTLGSFTATNGTGSTITLNQTGQIVFGGDGTALATPAATQTILDGKTLNAQGGLLDFTSGSGIIKVATTYEDQTYTEGNEPGTDLDIKVAAGQTASIQLNALKDEDGNLHRGILHFGEGSLVELQNKDRTAGGILAIESNSTQKVGSIAKFDSGSVITSTVAATGTTPAFITVYGAGDTNENQKSELQIDGDVLVSFLTADRPTEDLQNSKADDAAGAIVLRKNSILQINTDKTVELSAAKTQFEEESNTIDLLIQSGTMAKTQAGTVNVVNNTAIKADNLQVSEQIAGGKTSGTLSLESNTLTLGSATYSGSNSKGTLANFGFSGATVHDKLTLVAQDGADNFTLLNTIKFDRDYYQQTTDTDGKEINSLQENSAGVIELTGGANAQIVLGSGGGSGVPGNLNISGGKWVLNDDIKVVSGTIAVGADAAEPTATSGIYYNNGNPASLKITGEVTLAHASDPNKAKITVTGAAGANATLDLTEATLNPAGSGSIVVSGSIINAAQFKDETAQNFYASDFYKQVGWGKLLMTSAQLEDFFNASSNETLINISGSGVLAIDGMTTGNVFDVTKFSGTPKKGVVALNGNNTSGEHKAYLLVDGDLNLQDASGSNDGLDIGQYGVIVAKNVDIENLNKKYDGNIDDTKFKQGEIVVSEGFSTNSSTLVLGDGTSAAQLTLDAGAGNTGTLSLDSNGTIKMAGTGASALNVGSGIWNTTYDVDLGTNGVISVGGNKQDGEAAVFSADNLKAQTGTTLTVEQTGQATLNTLQLTSTGNTVKGKLIVNGRDDIDPENTKDPAVAYNKTAGITLGANSVTVSGAGSLLEFGSIATEKLVPFDAKVTDEEKESKLQFASGGIAANAIELKDFAEVKFNFGEGVTFEEVDALKIKDLLNVDNSSSATINVGDANLGLNFVEADGKVSIKWDDVEPFINVVGAQTTSNKLKSALVFGIEKSDKVKGKYGALQMVDGVASDYKVSLNGATGLFNSAVSDGYFVFSNINGTKTPLGVKLEDGASLELYNGGIIGSIEGNGKATPDESSNNAVVIHSENAETLTHVQGSITKVGDLEVLSNTLVDGDIDSKYLYVGANLDNSEKAASTTTVALEVDAGAKLTTGNLNIVSKSRYEDSFILGSVTANDVTLNKNSLNVLNGSLVAKKLTLDADSEIIVGYDPESDSLADDPDTIFDETKSYTGYLQVSSLVLNGGLLAIDPEYGQDTAFASVTSLSGYDVLTNDQKTFNAGTLDGSAFVGQNSVLGVGTENLDEIKAIAAPYMYGNTLKANETGSIIYLGKKINVAANEGITLTAQSYDDFIKYFNANNDKNTALHDFVVDQDPIIANTIYLGANTALVLNEDAVANSKVTEGTTANGVIHFAGNNGQVIADGGRIDITGNVRANATYQIFNDDDNSISIIQMNGETYSTESDYAIEVTTANGFLVGYVDEKGQTSLDVNPDRAVMSGASNPVYTSLVAYAQGYNGDNAEDKDAALYKEMVDSKDSEGNPIQVPNTDYNNDVLQYSISTGNGADAEKVARLGIYGGAAQAALTAGATTYEAVAGRMGMGAQANSITFADNGQGAGLWVTPIYRNHDSDGFEVQGLSYGADMDMYGVALGGDYTLGNGLRVGAAFNVGSGDADGQGAGAGVSNDFDYYGFTVYGGYTMDKLSIVADASYTAVDNDVESNIALGKVSSSLDTSSLSVGVTGQYTFNLNAVDVTPHAGMRYTYIDMDDYSVKGEDGYDVARYSADSMSIFSIPVGVTFSKEIVSGEWTVKPSFDLTLTANVGDDSMDGSVTWDGVQNLQTNLESEVIDSFTYGATLGVSAKTGNFSMGFGVNYTGASNADEYGVAANARFVF